MSLTPERLVLGCAPLGGLFETVTDDDATATVDAAWDHGIRWFDTAPLYGHGTSERRLGAALAGRPRDDYVLCTKVGRVLEAGTDPDTIFRDVPDVRPRFDFSADGVRRSLEASLERLGVDRIDVVHVHDPDDHLDAAIAEAYPALQRLVDEGVIGAIGLGTNTPAVAERVLQEVAIDHLLLAGRITLLDRSGLDAVLPLAESRGVGVLAAGVFNSGLLADPTPGAPFHYAPAPDDVVATAARLRTLATAADTSLLAAAVQYPARFSGVTRVVVGARSPAEVAADVGAAAEAVPESLWPELDRVAHVAPGTDGASPHRGDHR